MRRLILPLLVLAVTVSYPLAQAPGADERIDPDVIARIRDEATRNSKVMDIEHQLTDVFGPRVTGSPNLERAGKWAVETMEGWGLKNGALEPWDWKHEGWLNEEAYGSIVSPVRDNLVFEVEAWTPSTDGTVTGPAIRLSPPLGPAMEGAGGGYLPPTEEELTKYLSTMGSKVRNAMVLVGSPRVPPFVETESAKRLSSDTLLQRYGGDPAARRGGRGGRGRGGPAPAAPEGPVRLTAVQYYQRLHEFLIKSGAAVRIVDAYRRHGQIAAYSAGGIEGVPPAAQYDSTKTLPTVMLRNEDYGRIARLLADGLDVRLKFHIVNRAYPGGRTAYNAIAEIPGSDRADEVVMLGGHLDSWHSATGATDNGIGCAVMMEAVRILQTIGVKPRRTIRVALWSGEEQGLLGSLAYVAQHFGTAESPKSEWGKLSAYWNIDNGTGKVRGATVFGPPEAARLVATLLKPFEDLGFAGASPSTSRGGGSTDSGAFNRAGLPGINAEQDPMEYETFTHHTNLDTYERIVPADVRANAIMTAALVYHLAMREEMVPRFTPEAMPAGRGR